MRIEDVTGSDRTDVLAVERAAFGGDEEADLVAALLDDPTARPTLSLLAFEDERPVGHVLFTAARVEGASSDISAAILAPLAVVPDAQGHGVGGALVERGLGLLGESGVDLVFVLGHPGYYPRFGFEPAGRRGLAAPYPIPAEHADAWMVRAHRPDILGSVRGTVVCSGALSRPELWRE